MGSAKAAAAGRAGSGARDRTMAFGGNNSFNDLLQQAAKIKGAQMEKERKKFEKWPEFLKQSLTHQIPKEIEPLRSPDLTPAGTRARPRGFDAALGSPIPHLPQRIAQCCDLLPCVAALP